MATNLKILLARNRQTLENFCKNNAISSYKSFVDYCIAKNIKPYTEEEYNLSIQALSVEPLTIEPDDKEKKTTKQKPKRKSKSSSS